LELEYLIERAKKEKLPLEKIDFFKEVRE